MKIDWILLARINKIILLKRISLSALVIVPILATVWLIIKPQFKNIEQNKNILEQIDLKFHEINMKLVENNLNQKDIKILTTKTDLLNQTINQLDNHIQNYQFNFPISLALIFFASLIVIITNIIFEAGFPEELKNKNIESYIQKVLEIERTELLIEEYKTILYANNVSLPIMPAHLSNNESKYKEYQINIIREGALLEFNKYRNRNFGLIILSVILYLIGIVLLAIVIEKQISIVLNATF